MRPGVKLTVLCETGERDKLAGIILSETTSIGIRHYETGRIKRGRTIREVATRYGKIRVKASTFGGSKRFMPEYEDCKKRAQENGVPLIEVMEEAKRAAAKPRRG